MNGSIAQQLEEDRDYGELTKLYEFLETIRNETQKIEDNIIY